jgi:hypothetical protein
MMESNFACKLFNIDKILLFFIIKKINTCIIAIILFCFRNQNLKVVCILELGRLSSADFYHHFLSLLFCWTSLSYVLRSAAMSKYLSTVSFVLFENYRVICMFDTLLRTISVGDIKPGVIP